MSTQDPTEGLAAAIAGQSPSTPVQETPPPAVYVGVVESVNTDGSYQTTVNGGLVQCQSVSTVIASAGSQVLVLVYDNVGWIIGLVATSAPVYGNGFQPGDYLDTINPSVSRPGWLARDGSSYSTTTYAALFAEIGYTYGGSGSTFNVPNDTGLFMVGVNGTFTLGSSGGSTTISVAQLPSHSHANTATASSSASSSASSTVSDPQHSHAGAPVDGGPTTGGGAGPATLIWTGPQNTGASPTGISVSTSVSTSVTTTVTMNNVATGSGTAFLPPYRAVNHWIKT